MTTIKLRRGTSADWTSINPILSQGEPGLETDTNKYKLGDGATAWNALPYFLDEVELSNTYASTASVAGKVGKGDLVLNVKDYGLKGDGTTEDLTALIAAITAAAAFGPVAVYFPAPTSVYNMVTPLPSVSNVTYRGSGMGAKLRWTSGPMLAISSSTLTGLNFVDLGVESLGSGAHLIDITGGGLTFSNFVRCDLNGKVANKSILNFTTDATNLFQVRFEGCKLWRQPTATVPGVNIVTSNAGVSRIVVSGGQWHSQGCTAGPFWRAESTSTVSYIAGLIFENITGEQNMGGMIHLYSANGGRISNVVDHDATGNYTDDVFKIDSTTGSTSRGFRFESGGTSGVATFATGKSHLSIPAGRGNWIGRVLNGGVEGVLNIGSTGRVSQHGGGDAKSVSVVTANTTVSIDMSLVIVNSTIARTITLPDPTALLSSGTIPIGREWAVKNIGTAAATVASAGTATIDGAASKSLAQWASARFVTDGTNWFVI